jgi:hypothetical protein
LSVQDISGRILQCRPSGFWGRRFRRGVFGGALHGGGAISHYIAHPPFSSACFGE